MTCIPSIDESENAIGVLVSAAFKPAERVLCLKLFFQVSESTKLVGGPIPLKSHS